VDRGLERAKPCEHWSEAQLLAEGFAANPAALKALQQRLSLTNADAAAAVGVRPRIYRYWLAGANPSPSALKLLAVLAGYLPWDGWEMHRGCLFPPGFNKGGIAPGDFHAVIFWRQLTSELQRQNRALEARVAELEGNAESSFPRAAAG
jgi:hypothetical protein